MSDSDDTDVLLLIPPNFFTVNANSNKDLSEVFSSVSLCDLSLPHFPKLYADEELARINERLATIDRQLTYEAAMDNDFVHSTPNTCRSRGTPKRQLLSEIDNYFGESSSKQNAIPLRMNCGYGGASSVPSNELLNSESAKLRHQASEVMKMHKNLLEYPKFSRDADQSSTPICQNGDGLLSLNELWNTNGNAESLSVQEERMRREHCEKTIQEQQKRLLEYEQKISVALQIDRTKDEALKKSQEIRDRLMAKVDQVEALCRQIEIFEKEKNALRVSNENLQINLERAQKEKEHSYHIIQKLQEKCEFTEMKLQNLTLTTNEVREITKKQQEDYEIRLSNSKQNEEKILQEKQSLKEETEKLLHQIEEKEKQLADRQSRIDSLCKENEAIHRFNQNLQEKEANLTKELESQRTSLKIYYQKQLEQVVSQKLKEFQQQLDQAEESLKAEGHKRERTIAQRAMKQMEMINEKNEQEVSLLAEKHREEIALYRAQLVNASKTIDSLQEKLKDCKSKRADIADKLHTVMESQWKKTLEILSVPIDGGRHNAISENAVCQVEAPENEIFETPTTSRNHRREKDLVQSYIDLLLKKSPKDIDGLEPFLSNAQSCDGKTGAKPPWK